MEGGSAVEADGRHRSPAGFGSGAGSGLVGEKSEFNWGINLKLGKCAYLSVGDVMVRVS